MMYALAVFQATYTANTTIFLGYLNMVASLQNQTISSSGITWTEENSHWKRFAFY